MNAETETQAEAPKVTTSSPESFDLISSEIAFHILTAAVSKVAGLGFQSSVVRNMSGSYNIAVTRYNPGIQEPETCHCPEFYITEQRPSESDLAEARANVEAGEVLEPV